MTDEYGPTDAGAAGHRDDGRSVGGGHASRRDVLKATGAGVAATGLGVGSIGSASGAERGVATPWLSVEGNEVRDPLDEQVILRGVNIPDPKRLERTVPARGKNWDHMIDLATDHERGWYANVIRIPVQPGDIAELPPIPVTDEEYHDPVTFTEDELLTYCEEYLDPVVEYCRQLNVYCIVDYHRHWGKLKWHDEDLDDEVRLFWNTVAPRYAEDPHVIYEVYNEPTLPGMYTNEWYNAKYAGVWRRWKKTAQPWVDVIREHAPENLIVVGSPGWSAMPEGAGIEEFDGDNLMYTYHIYPGHDIDTPEGFDQRTAAKPEGTNAVWEDVPLFMTEFGWEPRAGRWIGGTTDGFGDAVTTWADERPIHWTAWCFDTTWLPSMFDRAFVDEDSADAVGDPYSETIPEHCPDPPCEWNLLGRDEGSPDQFMGEPIRQLLEARRSDDLPQVDHDETPPPTPADLTAGGVDERSATLSWSGVSPSGAPLSHYVVTVNGREWLETEDASATVTDLLADRTHRLGVIAVDEYGNAADPATVTVATEAVAAGDPPSAPTGLALTERTYRSVTLSWEAPDSGGGADVARYVLSVDGERVARLRSDKTSYRLDGLELDGEYAVTLTAVDRAGQSSPAVSATVRPRPAHAAGDDVLVNDFEGSEPLRDNALGGWVGGSLVSEIEDGVAQAEWDGITYHGTTIDVDATDTPYLALKARGAEGYELSMLAVRVGGAETKIPVGDVTDDRIDESWTVVTIPLEEIGADLAQPGQVQFDSVWGTAGALEIDEIWLTGEPDLAGGLTVEGETDPTTPAESTPTAATPTTTERTPAGTPGPVGPNAELPGDPDADGLYEDVNGNDRQDIADAVDLFQNKDAVDPAFFDFNDSGEMEIGDAVSLFRENTG